MPTSMSRQEGRKGSLTMCQHRVYFNELLKTTNDVELCLFVLSLVYLLWEVELFEILCLV